MEGGDIKDFTTTSFGLVLAYLLPGVAGLTALALWCHGPSALWSLAAATVKEEGGAAAFVFLGFLLAFLLGTIINGIRMITIDRFVMWKWKNLDMDESYFSELNAEDLACVITVVDEYFRSFQFFGGLLFVVPIFWWGMSHWTEHLYILAASCIALLVSAARATYLSRKYYVKIAMEILGVVRRPAIQGTEPGQARQGHDLQLTVTGESFTKRSRVLWNGREQATNFVNATRLVARIPAAQVNRPVNQPSARITVINGRASDDHTIPVS